MSNNYAEIPNLVNNRDTTLSLRGYDNIVVNFKITLNLGSYLIDAFEYDFDDNDGPIITYPHNVYLEDNDYQHVFEFTHEYLDPNIYGRKYLPELSAWDWLSYAEETDLTGAPAMPQFKYTTHRNLYDYMNNCPRYTDTLTKYISVYERWPEPRFYLNFDNSPETRYDYFNPDDDADDYIRNHPVYNKELYRLSNSTDAVRNDVIIAYDGVGIIDVLDRSIARSFPIETWEIEVNDGTDPKTILQQYQIDESNNLILNLLPDSQSVFNNLTGIELDLGKNIIELEVYALESGTTSDRHFQQCVHIKPVGPIAYYSIEVINSNTIRLIDKSVSNSYPIVEWKWDLGIGHGDSIIYGQNPGDRTIPIPGKYYVKLTVTDEIGLTDSYIKNFDIPDEYSYEIGDRHDINPPGGYINIDDLLNAPPPSSNFLTSTTNKLEILKTAIDKEGNLICVFKQKDDENNGLTQINFASLTGEILLDE